MFLWEIWESSVPIGNMGQICFYEKYLQALFLWKISASSVPMGNIGKIWSYGKYLQALFLWEISASSVPMGNIGKIWSYGKYLKVTSTKGGIPLGQLKINLFYGDGDKLQLCFLYYVKILITWG